jgi:hypothetical protein
MTLCLEDDLMSVDSAIGKKHHLKELKEMIHENPSEPVGKVLANFCHRHSVPMDQCKKYYDELVAKGEIKEK